MKDALFLRLYVVLAAAPFRYAIHPPRGLTERDQSEWCLRHTSTIYVPPFRFVSKRPDKPSLAIVEPVGPDVEPPGTGILAPAVLLAALTVAVGVAPARAAAATATDAATDGMHLAL